MPSNLKPKADEGSGRRDPEANGGKAEAAERSWKQEAKGKA